MIENNLVKLQSLNSGKFNVVLIEVAYIKVNYEVLFCV